MSTLRSHLNALHLSDIRGLAGLAIHGTRDVAAVVEGVHQSIHATLGLRQGATAGITGLVYRSIDGVVGLTAAGIDATLGLAEPLARRLGHAPVSSERREVLIGALNGVLGDRLAAEANPLALSMTFHHAGEPVDWDAAETVPMARGKVLLMIHGLCMTEHCWSQRQGVQQVHPLRDLAVELGYTPIALRYNTGKSIAENGRELARQLERLLARWPVAIEDLTLLGHSMGGLLARSAVQQGERLGHAWPARLRHLVFLGTPHHGAPLERAGAWLDALLHRIPHTRPFAGLSRRRSQGIRDLGRGHIGPMPETPQAGADADPFSGPATASYGAVPEGVRALAIAGTLSGRAGPGGLSGALRQLAGDGLVPVNSALGRRADSEQEPNWPGYDGLIVPDTSHMDLLSSAEVCRHLREWIQ
jgi:pimeloyl-ACP methyl ester carboxylesterase